MSVPMRMLVSLWIAVGLIHAKPTSVTPNELPLSMEDFVIVLPTSSHRLPMVHASRHFRAGIRTFIPVESESIADEQMKSDLAPLFREIYSAYPSDHYMDRHNDGEKLNFVRPSPMAIDHYMDRHNDGEALNFVRPSPMAMSCLPCHSKAAAAKLTERYQGTGLANHSWTGCPCTTIQGCLLRHSLCAHKGVEDREFCAPYEDHYWLFDFLRDHPYSAPLNQQLANSWPLGGAGWLMSHGMMTRIPLDAGIDGFIKGVAAFDNPTWSHHAGDWGLALMLHEFGFVPTVPEYAALALGELYHKDFMVFSPPAGKAVAGESEVDPVVLRPMAYLSGTLPGCEIHNLNKNYSADAVDGAVSARGDPAPGTGTYKSRPSRSLKRQEKINTSRCMWIATHAVSVHMGLAWPPYYRDMGKVVGDVVKMASSYKSMFRLIREFNGHLVRDMDKFIHWRKRRGNDAGLLVQN
eukprot:gene18700-25222_t